MKLHTYGLLRNSFRPSQQIRTLRTYWRQRQDLVPSTGRHIQRMQKALTQMNIQLANVISDISGVTGQAIVKNPNLGETVNCNIIQSEIEGGVFLADLPPATVLRIQTQHHDCTAVTLAENSVLISGHPKYCPEPVLVAITGSS